jgi:hypothetical protein
MPRSGQPSPTSLISTTFGRPPGADSRRALPSKRPPSQSTRRFGCSNKTRWLAGARSRVRFQAGSVVLATRGFQGSERLVRKHWHGGWAQPERLLLGASPNSAGSGVRMGVAAGAATHRLDHQWHYPFGVPDPRFPACSLWARQPAWAGQRKSRAGGNFPWAVAQSGPARGALLGRESEAGAAPSG